MSRRSEIQNLISNYQRRLQKLKEKEATFGINTPPEILTEIEDIEAQIENLRTELEQPGFETIRILYVEDVPQHAERYKKILYAHFGETAVTHVITARKTPSELLDNPPDVLVADLFIPPGPNYTIPQEAEGLPRIGGNYAYGADICAVALQRGIPVVALSTAPIRHPVREPIEQARQKYGGIVHHLYKGDNPDESQLIATIKQCHQTPSEVEVLGQELQHWLKDQWLNAPDVAARLAILNEVQMKLYNASQPALTAIQTGAAGQPLRILLISHEPETEQERAILDQIKQLLGIS